MDPSQQKDLISKTLNGFLNQCNLATLTIHSTQGIERLKVEYFIIGHKLNVAKIWRRMLKQIVSRSITSRGALKQGPCTCSTFVISSHFSIYVVGLGECRECPQSLRYARTLSIKAEAEARYTEPTRSEIVLFPHI